MKIDWACAESNGDRYVVMVSAYKVCMVYQQTTPESGGCVSRDTLLTFRYTAGDVKMIHQLQSHRSCTAREFDTCLFRHGHAVPSL